MLNKLLNWLGWPVTTGLLVALLFLTLQRPQETKVPEPSANSYAHAVKNAAPSVVNIYTRKQLPKRQPLMRQRQQHDQNAPQPSSLGSGVIVSSAGYVLTNKHVIAGADEIIALLHDGREALAEVIGSDSDSDLAVLKIDLDNLNPIELGEPARALVGDIVLAIGNPFGVGQTVTQGIISATGRYGLGLNTYENFLQTDAAINPGNSGGALVDANGRLLGINTAVLDELGLASVGIGFAVPADSAMKTLSDIVQHGSVVRGWLGIEARQMTPQLAHSLGSQVINGVIITGIYNRGPAHMAGLMPRDIIVQIDDRVVKDARLSMYQIAQLEPGDSVALKVVRQDKLIHINATVGIRPSINTERQ